MPKKDVFFSEWTEFELKSRERCFCDCHTHPGTYHTNENKPCSVCQHVNAQGYFPTIYQAGWVEYWRSDTVYNFDYSF